MHKIQRNAPPDKLEEKNIEFNKRNDYTSYFLQRYIYFSNLRFFLPFFFFTRPHYGT